jgi:hypothetical protein
MAPAKIRKNRISSRAGSSTSRSFTAGSLECDSSPAGGNPGQRGSVRVALRTRGGYCAGWAGALDCAQLDDVPNGSIAFEAETERVSVCIGGRTLRRPLDLHTSDTKCPQGRNASRALFETSAPLFEFSFTALADRQIRFRCEFLSCPTSSTGCSSDRKTNR